MAGYDGFSMSNNARRAYDDGLVPASKTGVPASLVRQFVRASEWHHTSSQFNETEFFNPQEVRAVFGLEAREEFAVNPEAAAALAAYKNKSAATVHENCVVEWLEWAGSRKHPYCIERSASGCTVEISRQTATITLQDGTKFHKRLTTNGFSWRAA